MSFPKNITGVEKFFNENVKTKEEALQGAKYIIAEWISDNAFYRKWIRNFIFNNGNMVSKLKKNCLEDYIEVNMSALSEDFSFYTSLCPSCYFFCGLTSTIDLHDNQHTPKYECQTHAP